MVATGIHIVPLMPAEHVVAIAREAEHIGFDYCLVADEGFHPDVYACLGAVATQTERITIGPVTNGYTRHPAVTAAAVATLDQLSGGRAMVTLLAGGSMVLTPMGIAREQPYRRVEDTIEILRRLWTGDPVSWEGNHHRLERAELGLGQRSIPIWLATRGPLLLRLAGRVADGVLITVKPDLEGALDLVHEGVGAADRPRPQQAYLGRICYTPEMLEEQRRTLVYVLMDSPHRTLESLGLDDDAVALIQRAASENAPGLLDPLVTDDLLSRYQVAGAPAECHAQVVGLAETHGLDAVFADVLSPDLDENLRLLAETHPILAST